ncbi:hypothetical protein JL720_8569 [Aureococcus anophagefferens]|nr:hypothetical protein JL720_8569 [Aureococcus anophagefferens]
MENSLDHASLPDPSEPYEYETAYQRVFRPDKRLPDDAELKRFAALDAVARYPAGERAEIVLRALSALVANPAGPLDAAAVAAWVADREPPPRPPADGGEPRDARGLGRGPARRGAARATARRPSGRPARGRRGRGAAAGAAPLRRAPPGAAAPVAPASRLLAFRGRSWFVAGGGETLEDVASACGGCCPEQLAFINARMVAPTPDGWLDGDAADRAAVDAAFGDAGARLPAGAAVLLPSLGGPVAALRVAPGGGDARPAGCASATLAPSSRSPPRPRRLGRRRHDGPRVRRASGRHAPVDRGRGRGAARARGLEGPAARAPARDGAAGDALVDELWLRQLEWRAAPLGRDRRLPRARPCSCPARRPGPTSRRTSGADPSTATRPRGSSATSAARSRPRTSSPSFRRGTSRRGPGRRRGLRRPRRAAPPPGPAPPLVLAMRAARRAAAARCCAAAAPAALGAAPPQWGAAARGPAWRRSAAPDADANSRGAGRTAGRRARAGAGRAAGGRGPAVAGRAAGGRGPAGSAAASAPPGAARGAVLRRWGRVARPRGDGARRVTADGRPVCYGADDVWGLQQTVAREARPDFDAAFARDLAALRAAARITSEGVAHGWGMVARRTLEPGDVLADPTSVFRADDPPVSQMLGALSESYVKLPRGGGYFKIHKFVDDAARTGAAAWTFYTNEARAPDVANRRHADDDGGDDDARRTARGVARAVAEVARIFDCDPAALAALNACLVARKNFFALDADGGWETFLLPDDPPRGPARRRARRRLELPRRAEARARRRRGAAVVPRLRGAGAAGLRLRRGGRRAAEVADWTATEAALRRAAGAGAFDAGGLLKAGVVYRVARAPALRPFLPPPAFLDDASAAQLAPGY